jgi:protein arginine kinase activator
VDKNGRTQGKTRRADEGPSDQEEFCPWCGLTRRELYAQGQMGCARCYETFAAEVTQALKEIHGEDEHVGKT